VATSSASANPYVADGEQEAADVLRAEGITKRFGENTVLSGVDLRLRAGENLAILGKSGIGKSVFLKMVTGLLQPDSGSLSLWGESMDGLTDDEWRPFRLRLGMVFQSGALFDSMSVYDNVAFPLRARGDRGEREIRDVVEERLEWVELPDTAGRSPSELSGGMRRRIALARTLAVNPEFLLYDEPTAGLDPVTARKMAELMHNLDKKLRSTSILVTHDIECARQVSSRWAYLSAGRFLIDAAPEDVLASEIPEVQEFFRAPNRA